MIISHDEKLPSENVLSLGSGKRLFFNAKPLIIQKLIKKTEGFSLKANGLTSRLCLNNPAGTLSLHPARALPLTRQRLCLWTPARDIVPCNPTHVAARCASLTPYKRHNLLSLNGIYGMVRGSECSKKKGALPCAFALLIL
jgi:hypothetical protein